MILNLNKDHIIKINENFIKQGWGSRKDILNKYLDEQQSGKRIVLVYEENNEIKGYITLIISPTKGPFSLTNIPEISDFNVFKEYQGKGIGQKLLDNIINRSKKISDLVGIGVGLHAGYGTAQRMYIRNGFIPDGNGVYYKGEILEPYTECINDDDLVLYFIKKQT
ncbi:GNAT family N-acetyltransferase [Oceanivirga salmonicida]|uniref:GNAT family N-acetyltransferase n=1 Tax=Oceanivirga salmonicida TaxID=1769291 RepID=UPI00082A1D85|nr:GNAT family N-acetyltransferase [Oceanivirga salmonicida]